MDDNYIVVLYDSVGDPDAVSKELSSKHNMTVIDVYEHAIKGMNVKVSKQKIGALFEDPRVKFIEPNYVVTAAQVSQVLPTGVDRVDADLNPKASIDSNDDRVDSDIAIIDTGIDLYHPDLNMVSEVSFVKKAKTGNDDNGHGTHVAGIAAALDNGIGVVGVAPGARLHAVKVLDSAGFGTISQVVKGLDWVVKNSDVIDVANLSLICECHSKVMHGAIQKAVMQGITVVVAAGNQAMDASNLEPAAYPEVITVSAMVDTDGKCGGLGPSSHDGSEDDTFASFSNFGNAVDVAAPGVDILSTSMNGDYIERNGTSMASPHVAGAVALYLDGSSRDLNNDGEANELDAAIIRDAILSSATVNQSKTCDTSSGDGDGGFSGDIDGFPEPLVRAAEL